MYQLLKAYGKVKDYTQKWITVNAADWSFTALYNTFSSCYLILKEPFSDRTVGLNLDALKVEHNTDNQTISTFLNTQGNTSLATDFPARDFTKYYVKYADLFHAGYKVSATNMLYADDSPITRADKPDLKLTRKNTDYETFTKYGLVNINGYFHYTQNDTSGVYVKDGMKSCLLSNNNLGGILSFYDVGSIETIPITDSIIYRRNPTTSLYNECLFKLDKDLTNKHIAVVIGGYLHLLDDRVVSLSSSNVIRFNFLTVPLMERYYESVKYIDLTTLPIEKNTATNAISLESLKSDPVILSYLKLSQSFIILIDNTDLFIEHEYLKQSPNRNNAVASTPPIYPVVGGYGKIMNPWYSVEDGLYSLNMQHNHRDRFITNTVNQNDVTVGSPIRAKPIETSKCNNFYLKIGTINRRA